MISNVLYWISTGLLVPVVLLLIVFFIRALLMAGAFFSQYMQRKRTDRWLGSRVRELKAEDLPSLREELGQREQTPATVFATKIIDSRGDEAKTAFLLSEFEIESDRNISSSKMLTKLGPILGLMGTLIPMGPALVGLASGDIASMAYNMQVAFATTVVGLLISGIGYVTQQAKERWAVSDCAMLEYLADISENRGGRKR